ncbi:hypothetical protein [Fructobacillus cardui]|uniref:hypothetical protein n=1 Tax=Fructobacillus cardui TaxID=2893170 RepID=UPI00200B1D69|nr:hypothetical protein [Fructobacillus cardui]MCK8628145.1 hypothetical protein [Fructobacillus cardui]
MDSFKAIIKKRFPKPEQKVVETKDGFFIDGFPIRFVSEVQTKKLGSDVVQVNVEFLAKSYKKNI